MTPQISVALKVTSHMLYIPLMDQLCLYLYPMNKADRVAHILDTVGLMVKVSR